MSGPAKDWIGQTLSGGRYRVDAKLGEGGMGFVYKVWDRNLDSDVVIKAPRRSMLDDPEFSCRFALETRSLVKLSHPNIVKLTDVGEHQGLPFAVMQYLSGGTLDERQNYGRDGRPSPAAPGSLASWLPGMASALDFIHRKNYVHRDVKPANILFDMDGHAYLSDFGVAKVVSDAQASAKRGAALTGIGIVLGTPEYMAPELIMGNQFDGRVDQYALAATAYEILCGRKPFEGETPTAILVRQTTLEPPPMVELPSAGSEAISRVILKGLAKKPVERYATCAEFASALVVALAKAGARPPVDRLTCPSCATSFALPADLSILKGKKSRCRVCRAVLRFAIDGLSLIPIDPDTFTSPSGSVDLSTAGLPPTPARANRTVKLEAMPDSSQPTPAAAPRTNRTQKIEAMPDSTRPIPVSRATANRTQKIEAIPDSQRSIPASRPEANRTQKIGAIPNSGRPIPRSRPAANRTQKIEAMASWPALNTTEDVESPNPLSLSDETPARPFPLAVVGGAIGFAVLVIAGIVIALISSRSTSPFVASAELPISEESKTSPNFPPSLTSTRVSHDALSPTPAPKFTPIPTKTPPSKQATSEPKSPADQPATEPAPTDSGNRDLATNVPEKTDEVPNAHPAQNEDVADAEPKKSEPKSAHGKDAVTLKQIISDPAGFLDRVVSPSELITVDTRTVDASGPYEGLTIKNKDGDYQDARNSIHPFEIVVTSKLAAKLREQVIPRQLASTTYPAILKFKVVENPRLSGSFLGIVESLELLIYIDPKPISFSSHFYNKAFNVVIITEEGTQFVLSKNYERWKSTFPTKIVNQLRIAYENHFKAMRAAQFNQMFDRAAMEAAASNKFIQEQQQQQNEMVRKLFGR